MKTRTIAALIILSALSFSGCDDKLVLLPAVPPVPPAPPTTTFNSTTYTPIPDGGSTNSYIFVSGMGGTIGSRIYKVNIDITHPYVGDLYVYLQAPNGTTIELTSNNGGGGDNYSNTTFQTGATSITSGSAPFTAVYSPEQAFSGLNGATDGVWTLMMTDAATSDVGALNNWSVTIIN